MNGHVKEVCTKDDCGGTCNTCCLFICTVCGGAEACLPECCPGRRMTSEETDAVEAGRLDYCGGRWRGGKES